MSYLPRMTPEDRKFLVGLGVGLLFGLAILLGLAVWNLAI
jgi:hypothetical protein